MVGLMDGWMDDTVLPPVCSSQTSPPQPSSHVHLLVSVHVPWIQGLRQIAENYSYNNNNTLWMVMTTDYFV